jgi:hypothetical protein
MPCSSHIEVLTLDCCSLYARGGGVFRAKDLLPSQDLDRSVEPAFGAEVSIRTDA